MSLPDDLRLVVFDEIAGDAPHSYRVFLGAFLARLDADQVRYQVVRPHWRVPGTRSGFGHLAVSAIYRQLFYPIRARQALARDALPFFVSTGLAHILWMAPRHQHAVFFCHDVFAFIDSEHLGHRLDFGGRLRSWYLSLVQKPMIRRARLVLVPSEHTRHDLIETVGVPQDRIAVVPHSVDTTVFHPADRAVARLALNLPPDDPVVLAVVTPERRKNVDRLLDALVGVAEHHPRMHVALVGDLASRTAARCEQAPLKDFVRRFRDVPIAEMVRFYRAADCLAHVSLYEGFGYPVLEAMASGCAVISSNRGAAAEVVGDAAELVNPFQPVDITRGIDRVLADRAYRAVLVERGRRRSESFVVPNDYTRLLVDAWRS